MVGGTKEEFERVKGFLEGLFYLSTLLMSLKLFPFIFQAWEKESRIVV